jgi:hypothetical protein
VVAGREGALQTVDAAAVTATDLEEQADAPGFDSAGPGGIWACSERGTKDPRNGNSAAAAVQVKTQWFVLLSLVFTGRQGKSRGERKWKKMGKERSPISILILLPYIT